MWPHPPQKCNFLSLSGKFFFKKKGICDKYYVCRIVSPFDNILPQKKWLFIETQVDRRTRIHKMHVKVNSGANSHLKQKANMTTSMHESSSKSPWKQWPSVEIIQQFMHYQDQVQIFFIASAKSIFLVLHEFQLNVRSFILLINATTFCLANISHVKKSSPSKQATTLHVWHPDKQSPNILCRN